MVVGPNSASVSKMRVFPQTVHLRTSGGNIYGNGRVAKVKEGSEGIPGLSLV